MTNKNLTTKSWSGYELIDSGDNMKLERFGDIVLARPETQALWSKGKPELWDGAHAEFEFKDKKGHWKIHKSLPESWPVTWMNLKLVARPTAFKHTGIFPEQVPNWEWVAERVSKIEKPSVLNLFGYTGTASIVAAQAGAVVTHVDASKQSVTWANENAKASGVENIRWIVEDALAFVKREIRRGATYDGIILDPPAFGRGAKGEVWHIEEHLPALLTSLKDLLSSTAGAFFLVNGYAAGYAPLSFAQAIQDIFGNPPAGGEGEFGELHIEESGASRQIPSGIYVRFVR